MEEKQDFAEKLVKEVTGDYTYECGINCPNCNTISKYNIPKGQTARIFRTRAKCKVCECSLKENPLLG